jgi:cyclohexa-1,5-dienecarbonyl-CoA hydratase
MVYDKSQLLLETVSLSVCWLTKRHEWCDMGVLVEKNGRVVRIAWERSPLNVLDVTLLRELDQGLAGCAIDPGADILVLQGAGDRAFSAGVDIRDHTPEKVPEMLGVVHGVVRKLLTLPQITIAAVRGVCLGGGCEIASSCDLIVASEESAFATPEIFVGCYPPVALARFPFLIGYHRAAEMILTGRRFPAQEARAMGLVNRVFSAAEFDNGLQALVDELLGKSGAVLRLALKGLRELSRQNFDQTLKRSEEIYCRELLQTKDVSEGVAAFLQKRSPQWSHR